MSTLETNNRLSAILAQLRWHARPERYALVGLDPRERLLALQLLAGITRSFWQIVVEPHLITLLLAEPDWREISPAFPAAHTQWHFRAISFDLDLPEDLVGFMAAITGALAGAGIPLLAICTYARDHVLVREDHLDAALQAIESLVAAAK